MAVNRIVRIVENRWVNDENFLLSVELPERPKPGQFVMVSQADDRADPFLPRPISVFDWEDGVLRLLIRVVGKGTRLLSTMDKGELVRLVGHLGNGFPDHEGTVVFVGGGIGIAPLFYTAKCSKAEEKIFVLGFKNKDAVIMEDEFRKLGKVIVTTDDGTSGHHGFPHQYIGKMMENKHHIDMVLTCGPEPMMEAVHRTVHGSGIHDFHSLEARMGCGIGACLGCRVDLPGGSFLVCKEGPVFEGDEIYEEKA